MNIRIVCPSCQAACNVKEEVLGKRVRCPKCKAAFTAESSPPAAAPKEKAAPERRSRPPAPVDPPVARRRPRDEDDEDDRVERRRRPRDEDDEDVAPRRRRAHADDEEDEEDFEPRRKPAAAKKKSSSLALILIIGGVVGMLAVGACIVVVVVFWNGLFGEGEGGNVENRRVANPGPFGDGPPPNMANRGGPKKPGEAATTTPVASLPPAPRSLAWVSPVPEDATAAKQAAAPANATLAVDVLNRVKGATVHLTVHMPDGGIGEGSGFFAVEPNIVLTNAHVVGMLHNDGTRPKTIEVTRNGGTAEEKKFAAEVLGVDRNADLAVLRVKEPGLPPPLEVRPAKYLHETDQVWVFGFPLGGTLGKEVTVSPSAVSSFRRDNGVLSRVQVNGGMQPGNSGGPVVDSHGNVVGVAVSIIRGTAINFAVPGEFVHTILNGRVSRLTVGQPGVKDGVIRAQVTMRTIDPLGRIQKPALEVWTGDAKPADRSASFAAPEVKAGDSPHQRFPLTYKEDFARGEITLPALPSGKAYWIQPVWTSAAGKSQWISANAVELPPAAEQRPVTLTFKHQVGSRPVVLNHWADLRHHVGGGEAHFTLNTEAKLTETTEAVDKDEFANARVQYKDFNHEMHFENEPAQRDEALERFRPELSKVAMTLRLDKQGNIVTQQDMSPYIQLDADGVADLQEQFAMLRTLAVPLPNKQVAPGDSWKAQRTVSAHILRGGWVATGNLDMTYTYIGARKVGGREEAVLALEGEFPKYKKGAMVLGGRAEGTALVDVGTGQTNSVDLFITFDYDANRSSQVAWSNGTLTLQMRRNPSP